MMVADAGIFQNQVYADPLGAGLRGYGLGNMVFQQREQKRQEEEARQRAEQGAQQYQADISSLMTNPNATAQDYVQLSLKYPQAAKVIGDSWNLVEKNQRQAVFDDGMRAYSAAKSGKPELAAQIFQQRADAYRANGNEGAAEQSQFWADAITNNPTEAINMAGIYLSGYDPEKFTENFGKIQAEGRADALAPIKLRQEEAAATTAEATAGVAPQIAQIDLNTKIAEFDKKRFDADSAPERYQLDVQKIRSDIQNDRDRTRIAAMQAQLGREGNDLKRQELQLKLQDTLNTQQQKVQDRAAEAESAISTFDTTLWTIEQMKKHPGFTSAVGTNLNPLSSRFIPATDAADFQALYDTFKSQAFLSEVAKMKGMGALSDKEGSRLDSAIGALSLNQSEKSFNKSLQIIENTMKQGRNRLFDKYGIQARPVPPVPDQKSDIPATNVPSAAGMAGTSVSNW